MVSYTLLAPIVLPRRDDILGALFAFTAIGLDVY
jgi:hypothetical protein